MAVSLLRWVLLTVRSPFPSQSRAGVLDRGMAQCLVQAAVLWVMLLAPGTCSLLTGAEADAQDGRGQDQSSEGRDQGSLRPVELTDIFNGLDSEQFHLLGHLGGKRHWMKRRLFPVCHDPFWLVYELRMFCLHHQLCGTSALQGQPCR